MSITKKILFAAWSVLFVSGLAISPSAVAVPAPVLNSIAINPESAVIAVGSVATFTALGIYSNGTSRSLPTTKSYTTATLLENGKVLITGGYDGMATPMSTDEAELYDPATGVFSRIDAMTSMRDSHAATRLADGRVLITGGWADAPIVATAELYDPATGRFRATGSMAGNRGFHTSTLLPDGRVLVTGGSADAGAIATAELYNPATGTFSTTGSMSVPRAEHTATLLGSGKVLIVGGGTNVVELYDPSTGTFSNSGSMAAYRYGESATLLGNGQVLIEGGGADAELYDPATDTFSATGPQIEWRQFHAATLLANGQVLIAGGGTAELYDPATSVFSATGAMPGWDYDHTATLLGNGNVLVYGGYSQPMAELYDTASGTWQDAGYNLGEPPASWSHNNPGVAEGTQYPDGYYLTGLLRGTTTLTATSGSISGSTSVIVRNPPFASFTFPDSVAPGEVVQLDGSASYSPDGYIASYSWSQYYGPAVTLNSYDSAITSFIAPATNDWLGFSLIVVDDVGLASGAAAVIMVTTTISTSSTSSSSSTTTSSSTTSSSGTTTTTSSTTTTSTTTTTIPPGTPTLTAITVNPASAEIQLGKSVQFTATGTYSDGSTKALPEPYNPIVWSIGDFSVALGDNIYSQTFTVTGRRLGTTSVTAQSNAISGSAPLTVVALPTYNSGRDDAIFYCSACHNGLTVNGVAVGGGAKNCPQRTVTEWTSTINRMNGKGCGVPTASIDGIANYLASLGTGGGTSTAPTTTTSGGGTTTTGAPTTTTTLGGSSTTASPTTTTQVRSTTTTTLTATTSSSTVATTTTTTICRTYVNGTTNYPYSGIGSCHGHNDNAGEHIVREEKWCQQHMDHFNNAGNQTHAYPHPMCM